MSSIRRLTSSDQAASTPWSAGPSSRLSNSEVAKAARSLRRQRQRLLEKLGNIGTHARILAPAGRAARDRTRQRGLTRRPQNWTVGKERADGARVGVVIRDRKSKSPINSKAPVVIRGL